MHPPGPENGEARDLAGCSRLSENFTSNDTGKIAETQQPCKNQFPDWPADIAAPKPLRGDRIKDGKDAPPEGYAFADTAEGQPKRLEPVTPPSQDGKLEPLTPERIALRAMMQWVLLCNGHPGKVTAFYFLIGEDTRRPGVIADALGISRKTFENYRNECRIWLDGFVAGLFGEASK